MLYIDTFLRLYITTWPFRVGSNYQNSKFIFGKISKFKGTLLAKKMNQKFLQICTSTQYELRVPIVESILSTLWIMKTKFHRILLRGFREVALFKRGIIESEFPANISINTFMHFITTKFHEILMRGIRGVALTNCFSSIFHFGKISNFKRSIIPRK